MSDTAQVYAIFAVAIVLAEAWGFWCYGFDEFWFNQVLPAVLLIQCVAILAVLG